MSEMKESSSSWVGKVPANWDVVKIKHALAERKENNNPVKTDYILSLTKDRGVIPYDEKGDLGNKSKENLEDYKLAYPNDIVLNSMNVIIGSVGLSKYFGAVSPVYYMLYKRFANDDIRYFNYVFQTEQFQKSLIGYGNGILAHRMRIQMLKLNSVLLPYPSSEKQRVISDYLDHKVALIDTIIEKAKQSIEEYIKLKQSIIKKTVTIGLNSETRTKPSGIKWLGEISENAELVSLKRLARINNGKEIKEIDGEIPVYGSGGVFKFTNDYLYEGVSILFGRKGTIDKPLIVDGKFWVVDTMFYTEILDIVVPKYLFYVSLGAINFEYFKSGSVLPSMTQFELGNIKLPIFDKPEQKKIIEFLDKKTKQIDGLVKQKVNLIEDLKRYKKSLIYEVVTGKKEIV